MHLVVLKPRAKTWKLRSLGIVAGGSGGQLGETSCGKQSSCLGLESGKVFCDRMSSKSLREITLILHFATPALKLVYSSSILRTVHISSNLAIHRHGSTKRASNNAETRDNETNSSKFHLSELCAFSAPSTSSAFCTHAVLQLWLLLKST